MSPALLLTVTIGGAAVVAIVLTMLVLELQKADRRAEGYRAAYDEMLRGFVKAEADLAVAKMLHGGEVARLTRQLREHDRT